MKHSKKNMPKSHSKSHDSWDSVSKVVTKNGVVSGYELSSGEIVSKKEAIKMTKDGCISGVEVVSSNGNTYLRSTPDGSGKNNLSNLPHEEIN